ncbi:MAG: TIGR00725 family protein [Chloroflexota bacterium]|nr:TIGR00725 family protein [Chloroflexota bacterium]
MIIGVIGGGKCSRTVAKLAEEVGRELAERNITLICGGLGGVMEAACRGAHKVGGQTIGVLPSNNPADANPYVTIPIVTGMGEMRNVIIVKSAQALIAINGEFGTLSEIGHALKRGVPVIGLNTWELFRAGKLNDSIIIAENAKDAVEKALSIIQKRF